jgi:hypothetical protein
MSKRHVGKHWNKFLRKGAPFSGAATGLTTVLRLTLASFATAVSGVWVSSAAKPRRAAGTGFRADLGSTVAFMRQQ